MLETDRLPPPSTTPGRRLADETAERDRWKSGSAYYHRSMEGLCGRFVAPGARVLELGCGTGDLLAALRPDPARSLGIDLSPAMVERARAKYPDLRFSAGDAEALDLEGRSFDYVVASDLLGHLQDIDATLRKWNRWIGRDRLEGAAS